MSVATFAIGGGMFAMLTYLTLYLQDLLGLSPFQGGLRLLPLTVLCFIVPLATRGLAEKTPPGVSLGTGLLLSSLGLALMHGVTATSSWTTLLAGLLVAGLGIGIANPAIAKIALGVVSPERSGMASGISNTFRIGGLATGVAGLGALFQGANRQFPVECLGHPAQSVAAAVAAEGTHGADARMLAQAHLTRAAGAAFSTGINDLLVTGAVVVFVGALFSLLVRARDFQQQRPAAPEPRDGPALLAEASPEATEALPRRRRAPRGTVRPMAADDVTWGLVDPSLLRRIVVVSPHFDDAILGAAHLLATYPGSTVITVLGGRPPAYPPEPTDWDACGGFVAGDDVVAATTRRGPGRHGLRGRTTRLARVRRPSVPGQGSSDPGRRTWPRRSAPPSTPLRPPPSSSPWVWPIRTMSSPTMPV